MKKWLQLLESADVCPQCGSPDCTCKPGECDCEPVEEGMPGRFAKSDDTKRAERNAKRRDQRSAERDAEKSKNDKLLDKYWRVFTDMAAQTYPDADPIDACFQKYRDFDMDKLNAAAKKHGYDDPMDYWGEMGDLPMEGKKKSPAGGPACWKGKKIHPTKPTKMKGGKRVNNCIDAGTKESFDPGAEPREYDELMDIYHQIGEEGLADALGLSPEELDQEINEIGFEHGLHADDDREEIIYKVIDDTISNADIDAYEETEVYEMEQLRKLAGLAEADDDTCTACSGKGHKPASGDMDRDCEKCDGTGKVKKSFSNMTPDEINKLPKNKKPLGAQMEEVEKVAEASDCDETCPKSCPDCGGTGKPKKDKVDESYPMAPYGQDTDTTEVSYNVNKKIGDAHLNINARAKSMDELKKVLQMAGLDPEGAEKHMPEPEVVAVNPEMDSGCGSEEPSDMSYSTDKQALVDMIRQKMQNKFS